MTPIQSQALDLLAFLFIWTVRIVGTVFVLAIVLGLFAGVMGGLSGH